jgi:hypothetical protein
VTERRKLSHDMRNEMNTLMLNMQCLRILDGSEAIESLDAMLSASEAIMKLVDRIDALPDEPQAPT